MKPLPTRAEGHLVAAAIRVLRHRNERPPTDVEVAELLARPREEVAHRIRGLVRHGVLVAVESAYDQRFEIEDHTRLETLPADDDAPVLRDELASYQEKAKERQGGLDVLFGQAEDEKRTRLTKLQSELERFKSRSRSPFAAADDDEDDEDDEDESAGS